MTIKINQHCLKIILQNDDFKNNASMGNAKKRGFAIDNRSVIKKTYTIIQPSDFCFINPKNTYDTT